MDRGKWPLPLNPLPAGPLPGSMVVSPKPKICLECKALDKKLFGCTLCNLYELRAEATLVHRTALECYYTTRTLLLRNFDFGTTDDEVEEFIKDLAPTYSIDAVYLIQDEFRLEPKKLAYVGMRSVESAVELYNHLEDLSPLVYNGCELILTFCKYNYIGNKSTWHRKPPKPWENGNWKTL